MRSEKTRRRRTPTSGKSTRIAVTCLTLAGAAMGAVGEVTTWAVAQKEQVAREMSLFEWPWATSTTPPKMTNAMQHSARMTLERAVSREFAFRRTIIMTIP